MPTYHAYPTQPIARLLPDTLTISPEGVLEIASHPLPALARQYGTPLYIFDRTTILKACASYRQAFQKYYSASPVQILYASKAYLSPLIAQLMAKQGVGLDIVSGGELLLAQRAAFPMEHVLFHGNNKSEEELRLALTLGVGRIVLDNWSELGRQAEMSSGRHPNPQASAKPAKSRSKGRLPDESSGSGGPSWMPKAKMKTPRAITVAARRAAKILVRRIALGCIERC